MDDDRDHDIIGSLGRVIDGLHAIQGFCAQYYVTNRAECEEIEAIANSAAIVLRVVMGQDSDIKFDPKTFEAWRRIVCDEDKY